MIQSYKRWKTVAAVSVLLGSVIVADETNIRPGHPEWPRAWTTYRKVNTLEEDIADLKAHGVGLISWRSNTVEQAKEALEIARRTGMKYHIHLPEVTEHKGLVRQAELKPVPAIMIGGVLQGKAIDKWIQANGGIFPSDVVLAMRFGDECFHTKEGIRKSENQEAGDQVSRISERITPDILIPR